MLAPAAAPAISAESMRPVWPVQARGRLAGEGELHVVGELAGVDDVLGRAPAPGLRDARGGIRASFADLLSPDELRSLGGFLERIAAGRPA